MEYSTFEYVWNISVFDDGINNDGDVVLQIISITTDHYWHAVVWKYLYACMENKTSVEFTQVDLIFGKAEFIFFIYFLDFPQFA